MYKIICTIISSVSVSLASASLALPENNFVPGWMQEGSALSFRENDLYGHIDGGAELFLEFGFQELSVQNYLNGEDEITIEVYHMSDAIAALGIYLMKKGGESVNTSIRARNSTNSFQSIAAKGEYYIQINNFSGREDLLPAVIDMSNFILIQIADQTVTIFNILPKERLIPGSERIIRGPYALQPVYTFGEDNILLLKQNTPAVYAEYSDDNNLVYGRIQIEYSDTTAARSAFEHLRKNLDPYLQILEKKESQFIFRDYNKKYGRVTLTGQILELVFNRENL